jgi:3-dehydroquinate synthase
MIYFDSLFSSDALKTMCQTGFSQLVIITDTNVGPLYAERLAEQLAERTPCSLITIPAGEASKSRETKALLEDELFTRGCGRDTLLIALGGGVITDLVGFVAATYCRGIPVVYIPTSLLAMVDASIGGKTGINTAFGKNMLGTFTEPRAVIIDPAFLQTLPEQEYLHAFAEIIKHALIADADYFDYIKANINNIKARDKTTLLALIKKSCEIKSAVVALDAREAAARESLNFGHTIAHALEVLSDYAIHHGHAVAIGMVMESMLSHRLGFLSKQDLERIHALLHALNLPLTYPFEITEAVLLQALTLDKKTRQRKPRFVLLERIGRVYMDCGQYAHTVNPEQLKNITAYLAHHQLILT